MLTEFPAAVTYIVNVHKHPSRKEGMAYYSMGKPALRDSLDIIGRAPPHPRGTLR